MAMESQVTRRHLMRLGALTGVGAAILAFPRAQARADEKLSCPEQPTTFCNPNRPTTPTEAFKELMNGNRRWATETQKHPGEGTRRRKCNAENSQTPFAAILACIDSRVPPELVFDQGIGDLFPGRVAGNSVVPILEDSLRFGTENLGALLLFVLGHSRCGAVEAAVGFYLDHVRRFSHEPFFPYLSLSPAFAFIPPILPAVRAARKIVKKQGGDPNDATQVSPVAIDQHVILTVQYLLSREPFHRLVKCGTLLVKGGRYDLDTQRVKNLI
jgi:carbonic anhydrase